MQDQYPGLQPLAQAFAEDHILSLAVVHHRLHAGHYHSPWQCVRDIRVMFANCHALCATLPVIHAARWRVWLLAQRALMIVSGPNLPHGPRHARNARCRRHCLCPCATCDWLCPKY